MWTVRRIERTISTSPGLFSSFERLFVERLQQFLGCLKEQIAQFRAAIVWSSRHSLTSMRR